LAHLGAFHWLNILIIRGRGTGGWGYKRWRGKGIQGIGGYTELRVKGRRNKSEGGGERLV